MTSPSARWVIGATPMWSVMGLLAGLIWQAQNGSFAAAPAAPAPPATPAAPPAWRLLTRQYAPYALFLVGLFMLGYGTVTGTRYFDSQRQYALGFNYLESANGLFQKGDPDIQSILAFYQESTKYFEEALRIDPTNTSAYYKNGSAYTSMAQIYAQIADKVVKEGKMLEGQSYANLSDEKLEKAKDAYEKLIFNYDPDYAEIHYNMGIIYQLYADLIRRALQNKAPGSGFTREMAEEYERKSLDHLEMMGKVSIKPDVVMLLGNQYIMMDRIDKARDVFRAASHRPSADENMINSYYQTAVRTKDVAGAADALMLLWLRRPQNEQYLDSLVDILRHNDFTDLQARVVKRLEHINPVHPRLFELKIDLARRQNRPEQVLAEIGRYIQCDGQDLELYQLGAQAALHLGRPDAARELYNTILKVDRDARTSAGQSARAWLSGKSTPQPAAAAPVTSGSKILSGKPAAPAP